MTKYINELEDKSSLRFCIILALVGLTIVIAGCNSTPTPIDPKLIDQSFITGQPCTAPCWYGLVPDQSSETEALTKIKELPFVDHTKIKEWKNVNVFDYSNGSEILFDCVSPGGRTCGTVVSVEGIVKYIDLTIQYPLPLKTAIDILGTPEYLFYTPYPPHGDGCLVDLNWPQKSVSVRIIDRPTQQVCWDLEAGKAFNPNLQVTEVHYQAKEIALRNICDQLKCIPWPGFLDK